MPLLKESISMSYIYYDIHVYIKCFWLRWVVSNIRCREVWSLSTQYITLHNSRQFSEISGQVETSRVISQEVNQRTWLARSRDFKWRKLCILSMASDSIFVYWITGDWWQSGGRYFSAVLEWWSRIDIISIEGKWLIQVGLNNYKYMNYKFYLNFFTGTIDNCLKIVSEIYLCMNWLDYLCCCLFFWNIMWIILNMLNKEKYFNHSL